MEKKYLYDHTSFENAYEVGGYPWGFRLRTEVRYWIETHDEKNGGQRFCKCTKNPKNGKWCAPKKSTYLALACLFLNEEGHMHCEGVYDGNSDNLNQFIENHREHLSEYQIKTIKYLKAYKEVMKHVTCTIAPKPLMSKEEEEKREKEQLTVISNINYHINKLSKEQTV